MESDAAIRFAKIHVRCDGFSLIDKGSVVNDRFAGRNICQANAEAQARDARKITRARDDDVACANLGVVLVGYGEIFAGL